MLFRGEGLALEKRHLLVEDGDVAGDSDVAGHGVGQPDDIVADASAHARARGRQPPVLHVTFDELVLGGPQQVFASPLRVDEDDGHRVL